MKKIDTKEFNINYSDSLEKLITCTIDILNNKIIQYKDLFNITDLDVIKCNYFDNIEDFRLFIYNLGGNRESLPKYAKVTYDKCI